MMDKLKLFCFRLMVSLFGYWHHKHWVWSDINSEEWADTYECHGSDFKSAYIDGWCRE
jgi:hypothetical protein